MQNFPGQSLQNVPGYPSQNVTGAGHLQNQYPGQGIGGPVITNAQPQNVVRPTGSSAIPAPPGQPIQNYYGQPGQNVPPSVSLASRVQQMQLGPQGTCTLYICACVLCMQLYSTVYKVLTMYVAVCSVHLLCTYFCTSYDWERVTVVHVQATIRLYFLSCFQPFQLLLINSLHLQ